MAIGLGRMMGFTFPYISRSISEFWKLWHITLGAFMKDYLYILSFRFIDELYELYNLSEEEEYNDRVSFYEKRIRETKEWYLKIATKTQEKNQDLDSLIIGNARYMVWKDDQP